MLNEISKTIALLCLMGAFGGPAHAAPTDEAVSEVPAAAANDAEGKAIERAVAPDVPSGSRTVDMLIELQGKQASLGITAEERAASRPERPKPKADALGQQAVVPGATVNRTGLFGSDAAPVASPRQAQSGGARDAELRGGPAVPSAAGPAPDASQRTYAAGRTQTDERLGFLRTAVVWIRENRSLVIGAALGVLVAVGFASRGMAQRRR